MNIHTTKILNPLYSILPFYTTGWVVCNDWTDQGLGTAVGGNVVHNLNASLQDLDIKVLFSATGSDSDAIECYNLNSVATGDTGFTPNYVNNNEFWIQTGANGVARLNLTTGVFTLIPNGWFYKVIVTVKKHIVGITDGDKIYSTSQADTGKRWLDGKTIYRRAWTGTTAGAAVTNFSLGITVESICPGCIILIQSSTNGWQSSAATSGNGPAWYFTTAAQNSVTIYHNSGHLQGRPYVLILEYTV